MKAVYLPAIHCRRQHGFTLIELMVVVVIIGIIATIGLPIFQGHILSGNLNTAAPYLMNIAAKQRMHFNRMGTYLTVTAENDLQSRLGVDLSQAGDFCFFTLCTSTAANRCGVYNATTGAFETQAASAAVSTPDSATNPPEFQVFAALRQADDVSVNSAGTECTVGTSTGAQAAKRTPSGWVRVADQAGGQGRAVILSYPPPTEGRSGTAVSVGSHSVRLEWSGGIAVSDALDP
jgi:prepilin-type N-terminal cleavage/methylation domain-containing protein